MPMRARKFYNRNLQKSFVWSVLQEPIDRIIHKTYQYATLRKKISSKDGSIELNKFQDIILNMENQDYGYFMKSFRKELWFNTSSRRAFVNITNEVDTSLRESGIQEGLCLVNAMHISASVFKYCSGL